ncbi:hypothetical protein [Variovorax sp. NFACC27]|uniref:hypothetical protein n=1 Tax=unclassified Variovorax TaxID=663243 RepID=UPI003AB03FF3
MGDSWRALFNIPPSPASSAPSPLAGTTSCTRTQPDGFSENMACRYASNCAA